MALKYLIEAAAHALLPADVKAEYKAEGEKFRLDVEGVAPREKLEEFRDLNIGLKKELEKFKDVDPVKFKELAEIETDLRAGKLKDGKTVDQILEERTGKMKADYESKLTLATGEATAAKAELSKLKISDTALLLATKKGLRPSAAEDLKTRAERIFKLNEKGEPVAMDGDKVLFGNKGSELGLEEWLEELTAKAPHLFEPSGGTGAGHNKTTGASGVVGNPFKKGPDFNLTKQGELLKNDRPTALRLKAEAGL